MVQLCVVVITSSQIAVEPAELVALRVFNLHSLEEGMDHHL